MYQYFESSICALNPSCGAYYRRLLCLVSIVKARILALHFMKFRAIHYLQISSIFLLYNVVSCWSFTFVHMRLSTMTKYEKQLCV